MPPNPADRANWRLERVRIRSFRGVHELDLQLGQVTLLLGRNGLGKTTVFDAIDWALFGEEWRLGGYTGSARGLWANGSPSVTLEFAGGTLVRTLDGATFEGRPFSDGDLTADPSLFKNPRVGRERIRQFTYLAQDGMRQLIQEGDAAIRQQLLTTLAGIPFADLFARNAQNTLDELRQQKRERQSRATELEEKCRDLAERLRLARTAESRAAEVLERARKDLDATSDVPISALAARAEHRVKGAAREVGELAARSARLRDLASRLRDAQRERAKLADSVNALRVEAAAADARLAREERDLHEVAESVQSLSQSLKSAEEACAPRDREARQALERLELARERERIHADLKERAAEASRLREEADSLGRAAGEAKAAEELARAAFEGVQARRAAVSALIAVRRAAEAERAAGEGKAREECELERVSAERAETEMRLQNQRERMGRLGGAADRLRALVGEIRELQEKGGTCCVLCQHDYGSADALEKAYDQAWSVVVSAAKAAVDVSRSEQTVGKLAKLQDAIGAKVSAAAAAWAEASAKLANAKASAVAVGADLAGSSGDEEDASRLADEENRLRSDLARASSRREERRIAADEARRMLEAAEARLGEATKTHCAAGEVPEPKPELAEVEERYRYSCLERDRVRAERDGIFEKLQLARAAQAASGHLVVEAGLEKNRLTADLKRAEGSWRFLTDELTALTGEIRGGTGAAIEDDGVACAEAAVERNGVEHSNANNLLARLTTLREELVEISSSDAAHIDRALADARGDVKTELLEVDKLCRAEKRLVAIKTTVEAAVEKSGKMALANCRGVAEEILKRLSPHAHLTQMELSGDGILRLGDQNLGEGVEPVPYSSTGQLNCLAIALFLGLSLRQRVTRIPLVMLDEPVQNMDDVHHLNFFELIRAIGRDSQVVLSTADRNLGELWRKKLAVWASRLGQEVRVCRFVGFDSRNGPVVEQETPRRLGVVPSGAPSSG